MLENHDDHWPASPPLQQLSLETIGQKQVVLGVGAAGQSHWSISVEAANVEAVNVEAASVETAGPSDTSKRPGLKFDLACRCKTNPLWLGSSYCLDDSLEIIPLGDSRLDPQETGIAVRPADDQEMTYRWTFLVTKRDAE